MIFKSPIEGRLHFNFLDRGDRSARSLCAAGRNVPEFLFLETFIYFLIFFGFLIDNSQLPVESMLNFDDSLIL